MYTNKITNSNNFHLTTNHTIPTCSKPRISTPIDIPGSNRLSRLYIHNPSRTEQSRLIDLDLGYSNSLESESSSIYSTIESLPYTVGSSTFYIESESENFEALSFTPKKVGSSTFCMENISEKFEASSSMSIEDSPDEHEYATINLPPLLSSRVTIFQGDLDDNPCYFSIEERKIPPPVPPKKSYMILDKNTISIYESLPYMKEMSRRHTEFREKYCNK